ncbi:MAG: SGNH/GDSL hydrolase family protein [Muribaculaceae bacterium]|nr:SGNH/GDSL hydrolase family protein [Muribaculaceae bacterium]
MCNFQSKADSPRKSRIALLGDSMTWIGGDSCEKATGWTHTLKESGLYDNIDMLARSGATWTNTTATSPDLEFYCEVLHDNNVIYNQSLRLIEKYDQQKLADPDRIIIFAGANDAWFSDKRPGIYNSVDSLQSIAIRENNPSNVTSLYGSVSLACGILQERFPTAKLILVTPLQMSKVSEEIILKVSDIIEKAGLSKGCTVLRGDKEIAIRHSDEVNKHIYTYDGVHTNPQGAALVGNYIVDHLKTEK